MALKKINYNGQSKIILRLCEMVNQLIDGGGGGGSTVAYTQTLQSGTKTGEISIDGVSTDMYAPTQPTALSDLTNDEGFITSTVNNLTNYYKKSETYTQAEVDALISAIVTLDVLVVQTLPTQDISTTTIYLVPKQTAGTDDVYDEYLYVNNAWELIGTTQIDLSNYYTKTEADALLADKVDKVTGKQLSTEDFTSALKTKLEGIASGAEVNVQSDWNQSDSSADDYIKNKPTIPTVNNGTLTIKKGSTTLGTFTANQSGNSEVVIPESPIDINTETPTFTEASTRTNIASGETISTLFGKIKKFFTDIKDLAFIAKDGTSSTKYLRGDGTWQTFPTIPTDFVSKANGGTFGGNIGVDLQNGTTSAVGNSSLSLGNTIAQGTAKNSRGVLVLFGKGAYYGQFFDTNGLTANRNYYIPDKSGMLALTSDIPTNISQLTNDSGYRKPFLSRYQWSGITSDNWHKIFEVTYTNYNFLSLRMIVKVGYRAMMEVTAYIRFTQNGLVDSNTAIVIKSFDLNTVDSVVRIVAYQVNTNTLGFAILPTGSTSTIGFEILDITSEGSAIKTANFTVPNPFVVLGTTAPTKFGKHVTFVNSENIGSQTVAKATDADTLGGASVDAVGNTVNTILKRDSSGYARSYGFRSDKAADSVILAGSGVYCKDFNNSSYVACFASSFTNMSSKRYKENIKALTDEEAKKILDVETVTYDYKEEVVADDRHDKRGVIAEQVESIIPSVVTYEEINGELLPNGVDYSKFVPYLIKMVQLQQKEIDNLKAEILALKMN